MSAALVVIAKDPQPGHCKTRLCPPCTPAQAAHLAAAALSDTLEVVMDTPASRRVLVLDGSAVRWRRQGLEVIAQRPGPFAARLQGAFADVREPALVVGMDTPQLTRGLLEEGMAALEEFDSVLGPAIDGGYWSVGLRDAYPGAFADVEMSTSETLIQQLSTFARLGLSTYAQSVMRDVDTIADARAVATLAPSSRFARALARIA